ncbi:restriction endonuclease subunit S [Flavobacteriales bacterium]|nr:restriction endonuclease subunit S [Flavobacteriales bacterium]
MKEVSLIDVCAIKNGYAFKSSEFKDSGTPLIRISSFNNGPVYFDDRTVYVENEYLESKSTFKVEKGDVLIALSGATTGKYGLYTHDKPSLLNQRVGLLKSGVSQDLDDKYFYFYLSVLQKEIFRKAGGAAQPNISTKEISEFTIPLPPLDQQKKIAAILDSADAYRQKTKALIEKYDELTQSLFLKMFGDPVGNPKGLPTEQLGDLCEFYSGRAWKKGELGDKGYKLVRISNLHKPNFPYWLYDGELIEKHKIERGDLLFSWAGVQASIDVYIYEGEVAMLNQHIYNIKPKRSDISKLYLFNLLQLHLDNLRKSLGGGVGQFHLKKSDITSIKVLIPDFISMKKYMQSLDSLVNQKAQAQASLVQAEDLFNSLLQRAFKGELTT